MRDLTLVLIQLNLHNVGVSLQCNVGLDENVRNLSRGEFDIPDYVD